MINEIISIVVDRKEFFLELIFEHLGISLLSIAIAGCLGLLIGILISEFNKSSSFVLTIINFIYTIPSISLLGFLIPFSGIGNKTAVIALIVYALLPMVRSTYTGITNINPAILEAAKGMGSSNFQIIYKIKLPMALPVIMSGLRNMVIMTIALAGIASFIGAGGLGVAIYRGITTNNVALTMAGSLLIAILALVVDFMLGSIEKMINRRTSVKKKKKLFVVCGSILLFIPFAIFTGNSFKQEKIQIATKPITEQYILGEMLKELIEQETELKVELTHGVGGGTSNIQMGIEKGEFDIYPEYTGTGWHTVLKETDTYNEEMFEQLQKKYNDKFQLEWIGMYGFNNTYGLVVRREIAEKYNLHTYSDLAAISEKLTFGAEYDFYEREDGYEALCEKYGYKFKKTVDLDTGLKYQAINEGKIDVMNIFTTDGQLSVSDVVVLEDDKSFYPSYRCGNVVRQEILDMYPELRNVLRNFTNIVDNELVAEMNYQVEVRKNEPKQIAHYLLKEKGLVE